MKNVESNYNFCIFESRDIQLCFCSSFPKSRFTFVVNGAKNLRVALIAIAKWFKEITPIHLIRTMLVIIRRMIIES